MQLKSLFFVAALTSIAGPAFAMDLPPAVFESQEASPLSIGQGWYIRGDFGVNYQAKSGKPTYRSIDPVTGDYTQHGFDDSRLSSDFNYGVGVGYQFNDFLRTDMTVDWTTGGIRGKTDWESPCTPTVGTASTACRYDSQTYSGLGLMANGYFDLGTYWGLTPYLGAGAGVTYMSWSDVNQKITCSATVASDCNKINYDTAAKAGEDSWRMTYALMAGMTYDLSSHTKMDFGYRYSKIAGGNMFGFSSYEEALGAFGAKGKDKGLTRHEFRAGLRLTTW